MPETVIPETIQTLKKLTASAKAEKIELCTKTINRRGIEEKIAYLFSNHYLDKMENEIEADEFIKALAEKDNYNYIGKTEKGGDNNHTHDYVLMSIKWGDKLIGITTSVSKGDAHVHTIKLNTDSALLFVKANTNYGMVTETGAKSNAHLHSFEADIEKIKNTIPNVTVMSFKEEKKEEVESKNEEIHNTLFSAKECKDGKGHYSFSNKREAEMLLLKVSQMTAKPDWFNGELSELQIGVYNAVEKEYPNSLIFEDSYVAEMEMNFADKKKLDPKAKIRNKPSPVFPANSADVTDNKDHFPLGSISQARNALARVAQYDKAPSWYKGSLAALQQKVRKAVKAKYPSIDVTGLSEFYALRFKEDGNVFFMSLATSKINNAKNDAAIYFRNCPKANIDLVKFTSKEDGESKFEELGRIRLYESARPSFKFYSDEVQLSERDQEGNAKIEILREGDFNHEVYGRIPIDTNKLNEIIKNFKEDVLDREVSFDMNHLPELSAAAWVKNLSITKRNIKGVDRHVLNAYVKFTPRGEKAIKDGEFKYFSSEYTDNFVDKETGKEYGTTLKGGGLTNRPWIPGLAPIQLSEIETGIGIEKNFVEN